MTRLRPPAPVRRVWMRCAPPRPGWSRACWRIRPVRSSRHLLAGTVLGSPSTSYGSCSLPGRPRRVVLQRPEGEIRLLLLGEMEAEDRVEAVQHPPQVPDVLGAGPGLRQILDKAPEAADETVDLLMPPAHGSRGILASE